MKVIIDGQQNEFINITRSGNHWQCNTKGNESAHSFSTHPKCFAKNSEVKTNGHIYIFN